MPEDKWVCAVPGTKHRCDSEHGSRYIAGVHCVQMFTYWWHTHQEELSFFPHLVDCERLREDRSCGCLPLTWEEMTKVIESTFVGDPHDE